MSSLPIEIINRILLFNSNNHANIIRPYINDYNEYLSSDDFIFFSKIGVKKIEFCKYTLKKNKYKISRKYTFTNNYTCYLKS